ncbi:MAG: putative glycoside hydrolase [Sporichthyaceae bacterium]
MTESEGLPPAAGAGAVEGRRGRSGRKAAVVGGVALLLIVAGAAASPLASGATVNLSANRDMASKYLSADAVKDLAFTVTGDRLDDVELTWDGAPVEGAREGDALVFRPVDVGEGKHSFTASTKGRFGRSASKTQAFELDTVAPIVAVDKQENVAADGPFTLTGSIEGAQTVKVDDRDVALDGGRFKVDYAKAPLAVKVWAQDAAGNVTEQAVSIGSNVPGVRAAHVTAFGWASDKVREPILALIKEKKLDTVQLDIKDEDGIVGYLSEVPLAKQAGTALDRYKAKEALEEIHALGARVTGRIVAFRDPRLGKWAQQNGKMDMLIQNTSGGPYSAGNYGVAAFTNFANPEVVEYNAALGEEAAKLGFDEIMYDYIRKPENQGQIYKGIGERTPSEAIVDFLKVATPRIRANGALVGAAVYGIAAFTPELVAQNVPEMAKHLDFVSPMVYPSHWGKGEYDVDFPNGQPYDIVKRSLMDFNRLVLGTKAIVVPWLQAFTLGPPTYTPKQLADQIRAAKDVGINSYFLWHAGSKYADLAGPALEARDAAGNAPSELVYSINKPGNFSEGTKDAVRAKQFIDAYLAWKDGGKQGLFANPLEQAAAGTDTTGTVPGTPTAPATPTAPPAGHAPTAGHVPAAPTTPAPSAPAVAKP